MELSVVSVVVEVGVVDVVGVVVVVGVVDVVVGVVTWHVSNPPAANSLSMLLI